MRKKLLRRVLLGAPLGLALSYAITIAISLTVGDGRFYAVVPALTTACGGDEALAVTLQALCSLLYGGAWGGASVIWESERLNLAAQSALHLAVCSCATFPTAWLLHWMRHSLGGVLSYFAIFCGVYLLVWLGQYWAIRRRLRQVNNRLSQSDPEP